MITALYVRKTSIYKTLLKSVYDKEKNAFNYTGNDVIIAHPPCRSWSRIKGLTKHLNGFERLTFYHALFIVRLNGGIIEHPFGTEAKKYFPKPGQFDKYGGTTFVLNQKDFGHVANKKTILYIVGLKSLKQLPPYPISFDLVTHSVGGSKAGYKDCSVKLREYTPIDFAKWLIDLAVIIHNNK